LPHLGPTGSSSGQPPSITARYFSSYPSDSTSRWTPCPPEYCKERLQVHLGCIQLSPSCPFRLLHTFSLLRPARHYSRLWIQRPSSGRRRDFNPPEQRAAQRTLWPRLTSDDPSPHLSMPVALSRSSDLPGYCALTFPLMPVGSTSRRSVQELGFASTGPLTPPCRLYPLPVRQASVLPPASSRFHLAMDTLAVQLTLPLAGRVEDFHLQVSAPCRAHQREGRVSTRPNWCRHIRLTSDSRAE
jgi:hypothetical protein